MLHLYNCFFLLSQHCYRKKKHDPPDPKCSCWPIFRPVMKPSRILLIFGGRCQNWAKRLKASEVQTSSSSRSSPAADGVQLRLQHGLVLLHHVPQGDCHMLPVLALRALQTHGRLAWLAVELHHLWGETNRGRRLFSVAATQDWQTGALYGL